MFGKVLGSFLALSLLVGCSSDTETTTRTSGGTGAGTGTGIGGSGAGGIFGTAGDTVYFDTDRAVLRDDARATLDRQADYLNQNRTMNISIAGNADERGTSEYNLALGGRRAYAAASYLAAKGISATRMATVSYGKDRPIAPGSTEDAWAKNRNAITSAR